MKIKSIPKHICSGDKLSSAIIKPRIYKPKGMHSIDKYNPRNYLRRPCTTNPSTRGNVLTEPLFYDYQIHIRIPSTSHKSRKPQYHQTIKYKEENTISSISKRVIKDPMGRLNYYKELPKTAIPNKGELDTLRMEKSGTVYSRDTSKEKYRRKWEKLSKRTLFNFEVDIDSNEVSLVRIKKCEVEDEVQNKIRTRMKFEGPNLSPHLQKKRGIDNKLRRDSIKVYYGLGSESPSKTIGPIDTSEEMNTKKELFKSILTSNMKVSLKLKKFLEKGPMETTFDLNNIKLAELDAGSYFHLYLALRKAVTPTFFGIFNTEINKLDPEIIEALNNDVTVTEYDNEIIKQYKSWIENVKKGKVSVGFWKVRKVYGCKPTCRESLTIACFEGKYYLFGGYGVDRMNDLWCLSVQDEELGSSVYNWTAIHPLGSKTPIKRYGHCMTAHDNNGYIFGGSSEFITGLKVRTVLNDIWRYSIGDNRWYEIKENITGRMYAASCTFADLWFIHGGNNGCPRSALSSSIIYSFSKSLNNRVEKKCLVEFVVMNKPRFADRIGTLEMHSAVSVLPRWLIQRNVTTNFWTSFHEWNISPNDPLTVH